MFDEVLFALSFSPLSSFVFIFSLSSYASLISVKARTQSRLEIATCILNTNNLYAEQKYVLNSYPKCIATAMWALSIDTEKYPEDLYPRSSTHY